MNPVIRPSNSSDFLGLTVNRTILLPLGDSSLSPCQHGLSPSKYCIADMIGLMDRMKQDSDDGDLSRDIFIDFEKTFSRIPHIHLQYTMESYCFLVSYKIS